MRKFKKFLVTAMTGAMMLGLTATATPAVSAYADTNAKFVTSESTTFYAVANKTRSTTGASISIDYDTMTATIKSNSPAPYISLGVYTVKSGSTGTTIKESKSYIYPNTTDGITVDLGFGSKKELYLYAYPNNEKPDLAELSVENLTKVEAQPEKLSVKIDTKQDTLVDALNSGGKAKEGKIFIEFVTGSAITAAADNSGKELRTLDQYEYRSSFGAKWEALSKFNYDTARVSGTKIVIRKKAISTPAGPETKVTISAAPNKKTAKITYKDGTVNLTGKMEIALVNGTIPKEYIPIATTDDEVKAIKKLTIQQLADLVNGNTGTGFKIIFREKADKKGPALPDFIDIPAVPALSAAVSGASVTVTKGDGTLVNASVSIEAGTGKNKNKYVLKAQGADFQYLKSKKSDGTLVWADIKMTAANGTAVAANGLLVTDKKITVRLKGVEDKKNNCYWLPSNELPLTAPALSNE